MKGGENDEPEDERREGQEDSVEWFRSQPVDPAVVRELFGSSPPELGNPPTLDEFIIFQKCMLYRHELEANPSGDPGEFDLCYGHFAAESFPWILVRIPKVLELRALGLSGTRINGTSLSYLRKLPLQSLRISHTEIDSESMIHLCDMPLEKLRLRGTRIDGNGLKLLSRLRLRELYLSDTLVGTADIVISNIRGMPLEVLFLDGTKIDGGALAELALLPLSKLALSSTQIRNEDLAHLKDRPLHQLSLDGTQVDGNGLKHLKKLPLQWLDLDNTRVGGEGLKHLKNLPLQELSLGNTQVDGDGLKHLKNLPLQELSLGNTKVDGDGLKHLNNLPLQRLLLNNTQVDGDGLKHLNNLPLQDLWLNNTQVDGPGLVDFLEHQLTHPDRLDEAGKARLEDISIHGCKRVLEDANGKRITGMPEEVLGIRDPKELLAALKQYLPGGGAKGRIPIRQAKLVILGNGEVGKTHLRHRLTHPDKPLPVIESTFAWEAVDWKPKGSSPLFRIFDFAGQVETHGAHRMFLASQRNFYLIVIRADKSLGDNRLDYWIRLIRTYGLRESSGRPGGTPPPITILINHCDCTLHKDFAPFEQPGKLDKFKADLKKDHNLGTLDIILGHSDTASDVHSYNRKSLKMLQDTLSRQAEAHKDDLAALYHPKAETLLAWCGGDEEAMPDSVFGLVTTLERFDDFCTELGISESFDHSLCLHLAANLGYVVSVSGEVSKRAEDEASWRGSLEHVRERVYSTLKLRDAVYDLVRGEGLIVSRAQLGDSPGKSHKGVPLGDLLAIMTTFGLIFPVSTEEYLIVDRLRDTDSPHSVPAEYVPVNIDFNLTFLSEAHLPRLAGEMYARYIRYGGVDLASEMRRNRIMLAHPTEPHCRAILIAEVNAAKLHLYISEDGTEQQKEELIGDIRRKVENVLENDKGMTTVREAASVATEAKARKAWAKFCGTKGVSVNVCIEILKLLCSSGDDDYKAVAAIRIKKVPEGHYGDSAVQRQLTLLDSHDIAEGKPQGYRRKPLGDLIVKLGFPNSDS